MMSESAVQGMEVRLPRFCSQCGQPVLPADPDKLASDQAKFVCPSGHKTYVNPVPVGVGILSVIGGGFLLIRRNINPGKGLLAFPGGNATPLHSIHNEIAREVYEEIGLITLPEYWKPLSFVSATGNGRVLLFALYLVPIPADFPWKFTDGEVSEVVIATQMPDDEDMAFPLHSEMLQQLLDD